MRRVKQLQKMIGSKTVDGNHCLTIADRVQSSRLHWMCRWSDHGSLPRLQMLGKNRNYNFLRGLEYILISPHCQGISFLSWLEQFPHPTVLPERLSSYRVNLNFNSVNKPPTFVEISGITASSNFYIKPLDCFTMQKTLEHNFNRFATHR